MQEVKLWTLEDANALLPRLDPMVSALREELEAFRFSMEQVSDLQRIHGHDAVRDSTNDAHKEFTSRAHEAQERRASAERILRQITALGVEMKDPILGLADFPAMRGADLVYLCWKQGEPEITHWHPLTTGFSGRKPVDELMRAGGR